jgi:hypothetical protein
MNDAFGVSAETRSDADPFATTALAELTAAEVIAAETEDRARDPSTE